MNFLHRGIAFLESRDLMAALFIVEMLALCGCIYLLYRMRRRERRQAELLRSERAFYRNLKGYYRAAQILLRRCDLFAEYGAGDLQRLTGLTLQDLREDIERLLEVADPTTAREMKKRFTDWDGRETLRRELYCERTERWLAIQVLPVEEKEYCLLTVSDITKDHNARTEMADALQAAKEENQSQSSFFSRMSHEIRTPINGIIGMLSLAKKRLNGQNDAVEGYLTKAEGLSQHLLGIINDILDMSRIEAGKIELESKPLKLRCLGDQLRSMFQSTAETKGIGFEVKYDGFTVQCVEGDQLRIMQVLINLVSNAVKFTSEGGVTVLFRQMLLKEDHVSFMIQVRDTGIGMDPDFLPKIFRPFEQESASTAKRYGGSGLGMAITDQLVRLMGGKIVVDSMPGEGSSFSVYLSLPIAAEESGTAEGASAAAAPAEVEFSFQGRRILLAEDNETNAEIAVSVLEEMEGAKVEVAQNGREAVDLFRQHEAGYYDLILMDVQMPVLDGRAATREIRALPRPDAAEIPIFALSADAFVEDRRRSEEAGMNGHFAKPIDYNKLRQNIGRYFQKKGAI